MLNSYSSCGTKLHNFKNFINQEVFKKDIFHPTLFAYWSTVEKAVNTDFFIACCKALTVPSFYKRAEGGSNKS